MKTFSAEPPLSPLPFEPTATSDPERVFLIQDIQRAMEMATDPTQVSILSMLHGFAIGYADTQPNIEFWRSLFQRVCTGEIVTIPGFAEAIPQHLRADPLLAPPTEPSPPLAPARMPRVKTAWHSLP